MTDPVETLFARTATREDFMFYGKFSDVRHRILAFLESGDQGPVLSAEAKNFPPGHAGVTKDGVVVLASDLHESMSASVHTIHERG